MQKKRTLHHSPDSVTETNAWYWKK